MLIPGGSRSREELAGVDADAFLERLGDLPGWIDRDRPRPVAQTRYNPLEMRGGLLVSRVVVAEPVAPAGLDLLRKAGHEVVDLAGQPRERLLAELGGRRRAPGPERDEGGRRAPRRRAAPFGRGPGRGGRGQRGRSGRDRLAESSS